MGITWNLNVLSRFCHTMRMIGGRNPMTMPLRMLLVVQYQESLTSEVQMT